LNKNSNADKLSHISNILGSALDEYRPAKDIKMLKIWDIWDDAVGSDIAMNAKPDSFKDGVLIVNVSSSPWLHQLKFSEKEMIENINKRLENTKLKQIRFKIGRIFG